MTSENTKQDNTPQKNGPDLWLDQFSKLREGAHKYVRGHALIYGAPELTGASRLAAEACARVGAGLVSVLSPKDIFDVYRASLLAHILVRDDVAWWDDRVTATLYGSGGLSTDIKLREKIATVLDADALFHLPAELNDRVVLTPHEGEFAKAFPDIKGSRFERATKAAQKTGAIIVLKGPSTLIVHPDGRSVINHHASPYLATAGTGDVLAGMITGLMAQKMEPFYATCAAIWMHGDCSIRFGPGLVASDLPDLIPGTLKNL